MHENASRKNNSDDYVVEQSSGLQIDNLSKVSGKELFRDSQYLVNVLHLRTGIYFSNSFVVVLFVVKIRRPYVCLLQENHVALHDLPINTGSCPSVTGIGL